METAARAVLVLNATYEPLNIISVQRAIVLPLKEKAELTIDHVVPRSRGGDDAPIGFDSATFRRHRSPGESHAQMAWHKYLRS